MTCLAWSSVGSCLSLDSLLWLTSVLPRTMAAASVDQHDRLDVLMTFQVFLYSLSRSVASSGLSSLSRSVTLSVRLRSSSSIFYMLSSCALGSGYRFLQNSNTQPVNYPPLPLPHAALQLILHSALAAFLLGATPGYLFNHFRSRPLHYILCRHTFLVFFGFRISLLSLSISIAHASTTLPISHS